MISADISFSGDTTSNISITGREEYVSTNKIDFIYQSINLLTEMDGDDIIDIKIDKGIYILISYKRMPVYYNTNLHTIL